MNDIDKLAHDIDCAVDAADVPALRQLCERCDQLLANAKGLENVLINYYQSNAYAGIALVFEVGAKDVDEWDQPDRVQSLLSLRRAVSRAEFSTIEPTFACQIHTNLGSRLNNLGRPIAANDNG